MFYSGYFRYFVALTFSLIVLIGFSKWLYLRYFVALTFSLIILIGFSKWLYLRKRKFELSGIWIFCDFCRLLDSSQNRSTFQKKKHVPITSVVTITDVIAPILQRFYTITDVIGLDSFPNTYIIYRIMFTILV